MYLTIVDHVGEKQVIIRRESNNFLDLMILVSGAIFLKTPIRNSLLLKNSWSVSIQGGKQLECEHTV